MYYVVTRYGRIEELKRYDMDDFVSYIDVSGELDLCIEESDGKPELGPVYSTWMRLYTSRTDAEIAKDAILWYRDITVRYMNGNLYD